MNKYEVVKTLGEGSFGVVTHAIDKETRRHVAIKRIKMVERSHDGVHFTALREIKFLIELKHPNIVEVSIDVVVGEKQKVTI
jgi:serine/threonine protein kinase